MKRENEGRFERSRQSQGVLKGGGVGSGTRFGVLALERGVPVVVSLLP
jgi:hypothetical protein